MDVLSFGYVISLDSVLLELHALFSFRGLQVLDSVLIKRASPISGVTL